MKRWLAKKDLVAGVKNDQVSPKQEAAKLPLREQHMAREVNRNRNYYCSQLGAACDFRIVDLPSDASVKWIAVQGLRFDSLYFYGAEGSIHISYELHHKRDIWTFTEKGTPIHQEIHL